MSRTPELSPKQRETAVELMRGLVLEYEGSSVKLAHALQKAGYASPKQQAISGIMHRYVNAGKTIAENLSEFIGRDFADCFSDDAIVVCGRLPGWVESERKAKESVKGAAIAPSSFVAVRYGLLRERHPKPSMNVVLERASEFERRATNREHDVIADWITRDSPGALTKLSFSRMRTT